MVEKPRFYICCRRLPEAYCTLNIVVRISVRNYFKIF